MDFFRSILSDDPDPESPNPYEQSDSNPPKNQSPNHQNETEEDEEEEEEEEEDEDDSTSYLNSSEDGSAIGIAGGGGGGLWSFGDLVKTLTTKSESVFETYRRDLKEFGTGLRKESDLFREVASRAVKELPSSIEVVGTSAIDGVLKSTAEFISQGKEKSLLLLPPPSSDASERRRLNSNSNSNSRRYSRFDSQLNAIMTDSKTYCEDPEDMEDYKKWKLGFVMGDNRDEIEKLVGDNGVLAGIYSKLVPIEVDDGSFWYRYFYKINKFKMQEDLRAKLVKRSLSQDIEEELSWDIDDDDDNNEEQEKSDHLRSNASKTRDLENVEKQVKNPKDESETQSSKILIEDKEMDSKNVSSVSKNDLEEPKPDGGKKVESEKVDLKPDENEDMEWDEFEDVENNDEKKNVIKDEIENKGDLVKRLSTAVDDDEDLSWDIEDDDDDVVKSGNK